MIKGWLNKARGKRPAKKSRLVQQEDPETKRIKMAQAASNRMADWRQKSSALNPKDKVLASIRTIYSHKGKDPPIGLASSSLPVLQKHLRYLKNH